MARKHGTPRTLVQAVRYFQDEQVCIDFLASIRWPDGVTCPTCRNTKVGYLEKQRRWQCSKKHAKRQFSVKVGTIFEDSPIGLDKWLPAMWLICSCKNGISSYELARAIGVTQQTGWFMLARLRLALQRGGLDKIDGPTEADETFIGGLARNMHVGKRREKITGTGGAGKALVVGLLDRKTRRVRVAHVPNRKRKTLQGHVQDNVQPGSELFTDEFVSYTGLDREYVHNVVNHAETYVEGHVHTNGIENFWALLKRTIKGTYVSVEPFHLFRYLDEQAYRFNEREHPRGDYGRFVEALRTIVGRRLTYRELTGDGISSPAAAPA
jgi:transposase-like protein